MKVSTENIIVQQSIDIIKPSIINTNSKKDIAVLNSKNVSEMTDNSGKPTKEAYQVAVNKMNEFMEATNNNSKFIFHEGLEKYYVEIVDAVTEEVVKEIPPKELLDAYYEMQKMIGKIVDQTI